MTDPIFSRPHFSQSQSQLLAEKFTHILQAGDIVLLEGQIGAGKTFFARHLIQSFLGVKEDVPSPTFTLVQTYDVNGFEIWHCDLYRLTGPDEAIELGLDLAFEQAICLVEWPDRLGDWTPKTALTLRIDMDDEQRCLTCSGDESWHRRLSSVAV